MKTPQVFFLISSELRNAYPPRRCIEMARLVSDDRDDYMLVSIEPPLSKEIYATYEKLDKLILATRFNGESLFPLTVPSVSVYICEPQDNVLMQSERIDVHRLKLLDKGEVYLTLNDANANNTSH